MIFIVAVVLVVVNRLLTTLCFAARFVQILQVVNISIKVLLFLNVVGCCCWNCCCIVISIWRYFVRNVAQKYTTNANATRPAACNDAIQGTPIWRIISKSLSVSSRHT